MNAPSDLIVDGEDIEDELALKIPAGGREISRAGTNHGLEGAKTAPWNPWIPSPPP